MEYPGILVDTHCHLTMDAFKDDRDAVIQRALSSGVQRIIVPGIDLDSSQEAITLSATHPSVYAAVGIHPHNAKFWDPEYCQKIISLAKSSKVVAIGEIGLDYYRNLSSHEQQMVAFRHQLDVASELQLPVIIHNRDATSDIIEYLLIWSKKQQKHYSSGIGVLHAFSADLQTALQIIDAGFLIGIAGPITYKNAESLRDIAHRIPSSSLLIETDAPYLTPHPYCSKRNEPANVIFVAEELSRIVGKDYKTTALLTSQNAADLFGWENGTNHRILH